MLSRLPNALTLLRIALVPLLVAAFYLPYPAAQWTAFAIFIVAGITDFADGHLARAMKSQSHLGAMLDPIADKLIVAAALVMLAAQGTLFGWALIPAIIILAREILVSGLREYLATLQVSVPVSSIAKWKTLLQLVAIALLIGGVPLDNVVHGTRDAGIYGLWLAAALTVYTGVAYVVASMKHFGARP